MECLHGYSKWRYHLVKRGQPHEGNFFPKMVHLAYPYLLYGHLQSRTHWSCLLTLLIVFQHSNLIWDDNVPRALQLLCHSLSCLWISTKWATRLKVCPRLSLYAPTGNNRNPQHPDIARHIQCFPCAFLPRWLSRQEWVLEYRSKWSISNYRQLRQYHRLHRGVSDSFHRLIHHGRHRFPVAQRSTHNPKDLLIGLYANGAQQV